MQLHITNMCCATRYGWTNTKAFKNKSLILTNIKIIYLNNILNIISIFVKATTKL
jgi:hypothetical protein